MFLMGYAGSGKTTVAEMLDALAGYEVFSLAAPIKAELARWLGRPATKAERSLMIEFGQTYRRWFGDDLWCRELRKDGVFRDCAGYGLAVIDDGRHLVEYDYFVVQRGFVPVRIVAPDEVRFERLLKRDGVDQRSVLAGRETELDGVEVAYVLDNSGTTDDLERQVSEMLAKISDSSFVAPQFPRILRIGDRVRLTDEAAKELTWYEPRQAYYRSTIAVVKDIVDGAYVLVHEKSDAWYMTVKRRKDLVLIEREGGEA